MIFKTGFTLLAYSAEKCVIRRLSRATSFPLTNSEVQEKRNHLFDKEKQRQESLTARIEKIHVQYVGLPEKCTLIMNKGISTPYNCAMHIHESLMQRSVLAEVDGKAWDMHRPLVQDCELKFHHFKEEDPYLVNKAFWRSCSMVLGKLIECVFKDEFYVELHSWPKPDIKSGSFVYDCDLKISNWHPTEIELRTLSTTFRNIAARALNFERLDVDASVALEMFEDNRFKHVQIPSIASSSPDGNTITLYRLGKFIDMSAGPMISNTKLIGSAQITAVHQVLVPDDGMLYRFQGVALPAELPLNGFAFKILADRAKALNKTGLPDQQVTASPPLEREESQQAQERVAFVNCIQPPPVV